MNWVLCKFLRVLFGIILHTFVHKIRNALVTKDISTLPIRKSRSKLHWRACLVVSRGSFDAVPLRPKSSNLLFQLPRWSLNSIIMIGMMAMLKDTYAYHSQVFPCFATFPRVPSNTLTCQRTAMPIYGLFGMDLHAWISHAYLWYPVISKHCNGIDIMKTAVANAIETCPYVSDKNLGTFHKRHCRNRLEMPRWNMKCV